MRKAKMTRDVFPYGRLVFFATGNYHKFDEARLVLAEFNIATAMLKTKASEVQDDDIENIAKASAVEVAQRICLPVIAEDAGLFIEALNGFPGPYSKFVHRTLGMEGVLTLLEKRQDREASFKSAVAFSNPLGEVKCFLGVVEGKITEEIRGTGGFGFDPIFEPKEKPRKTFGEMSLEDKSSVSHRSRALRDFAKWYQRNAVAKEL
jgi:XTP/dITP diphosphohydrolase